MNGSIPRELRLVTADTMPRIVDDQYRTLARRRHADLCLESEKYEEHAEKLM
jgi:hypothetical protein